MGPSIFTCVGQLISGLVTNACVNSSKILPICSFQIQSYPADQFGDNDSISPLGSKDDKKGKDGKGADKNVKKDDKGKKEEKKEEKVSCYTNLFFPNLLNLKFCLLSLFLPYFG